MFTPPWCLFLTHFGLGFQKIPEHEIWPIAMLLQAKVGGQATCYACLSKPDVKSQIHFCITSTIRSGNWTWLGDLVTLLYIYRVKILLWCAPLSPSDRKYMFQLEEFLGANSTTALQALGHPIKIFLSTVLATLVNNICTINTMFHATPTVHRNEI